MIVPFIHLRVHSQYSLLRGTATPESLASHAVASGMSRLALTDFNALYGAVRFREACRSEGVSPIVGMTVSVLPPPGLNLKSNADLGHIVLLARNRDGYRSLCRLSSHIQGRADREGYARRSSVSWELLREHRAGLICLSGGRRGWLEYLIRSQNQQEAGRFVSQLAGVFDEHAYLALELHTSADNDVAAQIDELSSRFGVKMAVVHPIYCLHPRDRESLHLLTAIERNTPLDKVPSSALPDGGDRRVELHWLESSMMLERYGRYPQALAETLTIAEQCQDALPDGRPLWPTLSLPENQTPDHALKSLAESDLKSRYRDSAMPGVFARLDRELKAIADHGYAPLFLLVADIVRYARSQQIPVSTRGSVANSLVAYCTGMTTVDPIAHDLLFERFLNPARTDPPDIDLDLCSRRRDEVLDYVRQRYGEHQVALVATISTMRAKSAVRETGKALGLREDEISALVKRLPRGWHPDPRRRSKLTLADFAEGLEDRRLREVVQQALPIVGQPHHLSVHPGGIVISPGFMTDVAPVQWAPKGFLITQYDHTDVETIGLVKVDLLGIRALTVLSDTAELVRTYHDPNFQIESIPLDDAGTGELLARAETVGVFQCDSTGAQRTLRKLKAKTVADLAIANAFFKPGPALGGMATRFVRRYRGEEAVRYLHPSLQPILGFTKGVLIFQEQILRVATEIAGLSWEQANQLRRGMSKFRAQDIENLQAQFVRGCMRPPPEGPGMSDRQAQTLWEQVLPFAGYGFNQGHATAYAVVSYRSAYLKTHYPAAFFCARLADWGGFHHPAIYMAEARRWGIVIHPPHVNRSGRKFTLSWEPGSNGDSTPHLCMGLGQVRNLRRASVEAIIAEREASVFTSPRDLLGRVPLQAKEARHLIQCGALDDLGESRAYMLAEAKSLGRQDNARQLRFDFIQIEAQPETLAQRLEWERHLLGHPLSAHPVDAAAGNVAGKESLAEARSSRGRVIQVMGVRLPGRTGGDGFFLADGTDYVVATVETGDKAPPIWEPRLIEGRWRQDAWGMGWLQVEKIEAVP